MVFRERLRAPAAAIPLKTVRVSARFLAVGLAIVAGHRFAFLREHADYEFGSALWLAPHIDLALPVVRIYRRGCLRVKLKSPYRLHVCRGQISRLAVHIDPFHFAGLDKSLQCSVDTLQNALKLLNRESNRLKVLSNSRGFLR